MPIKQSPLLVKLSLVISVLHLINPPSSSPIDPSHFTLSKPGNVQRAMWKLTTCKPIDVDGLQCKLMLTDLVNNAGTLLQNSMDPDMFFFSQNDPHHTELEGHMAKADFWETLNAIDHIVVDLGGFLESLCYDSSLDVVGLLNAIGLKLDMCSPALVPLDMKSMPS
eukprot:Gb_41593 [translate_table: standard]